MRDDRGYVERDDVPRLWVKNPEADSRTPASAPGDRRGLCAFHLRFSGGGWKDYYYSEGWWEGPIKLKAERPPTAEYKSLWDAENGRALLEFLKRPPVQGHIHFREEGSDEMVTLPILVLEQGTRSRALLILREVSLANAQLLAERSRILAVYPSPESVGELNSGDLEDLAFKAAEPA